MDLKLPLSIVSKADIARILREINTLDDFFVSANARQAGSSPQIPRVSTLLEVVARENQYNLLEEKNRAELIAKLQQVAEYSPLLHISFATEPSPKALERILQWFRQNIHSCALLQVGLQPTIAAGCILRTPNKIFDMSMREYLKQQEPYFAELINEAVSGKR
jgi:F0F1-type ATP synthase delta subunit